MTRKQWSLLDVQNKGELGTRMARHEIVEGHNVDGSRVLPCVCKMPDLSTRSYEYATEIVRRWNAHDELVVALKFSLEWLAKLSEQNSTAIMLDAQPPQGGFALIRAAITQVEGKE